MPKGHYQRGPRKAIFEADRDPVFEELDRAIRAEDAHEQRLAFRDSVFATRRRTSCPRYSSKSRTVRCPHCGAADSRDADHQSGCPSLPRVPDNQVAQMAREYAAMHAPPLASDADIRACRRLVSGAGGVQ